MDILYDAGEFSSTGHGKQNNFYIEQSNKLYELLQRMCKKCSQVKCQFKIFRQPMSPFQK